MLKGVNNITLPVYKELMKKINEVKESGIDISKLPTIASVHEMDIEDFNTIDGKAFFVEDETSVYYPIYKYAVQDYLYVTFNNDGGTAIFVNIYINDGTIEHDTYKFVMISEDVSSHIPNLNLYHINVYADSSQGDYFIRILMLARSVEEVKARLKECCKVTTNNNYELNLAYLNFNDYCINVSYYDNDGGTDQTMVRFNTPTPCKFEFNETDQDEHLYEVTNNFYMPVTQSTLDGESLLADVQILNKGDIVQLLIDNDYIYISRMN